MKKLDLEHAKVIVLVEGLTEQILLPYLARAYGLDLAASGAVIVSAGGAKKLLRKYLNLKERTNLPIFAIFDGDAYGYAVEMSAALRANDRLHILADGEIEDSMTLEFFVDQLNRYLAADCLNDGNKLVVASDFTSRQRRTAILDRIWRQRRLGRFQKVKFAQFIGNALCSRDSISQGGKDMLNNLSRSLKPAVSL